MFVIKNTLLPKKTGKQIRGKNIEASLSIFFFTFFIIVAVVISFIAQPFGKIQLLNNDVAMNLGLGIIFLNLIVSAASLINLKDSWRVGILENQITELVTVGIYRFTRNPYFVSYVLMFVAYTILLQNLVLLGLSISGLFFIHKMITKEESYLYSVHGDSYLKYKTKVPGYVII